MTWILSISAVLILSFTSIGAYASDTDQAAHLADCQAALTNSNSVIDHTQFTDLMQHFSQLSADVQGRLGRESVKAILLDDSGPLLRKNLSELLRTLTPASTVQDLSSTLSHRLQLRVPDRQLADRVNNLNGSNPESLRQALGAKTLAEMQELVYGADPLHPSPESLLGKYLAETHAATVTRTFPKGPTPQEGVGAPKLAVALAPARKALFDRYFNFPEILMHYHTVNQGTLLIYFNGRKLSYAGQSVQAATETTFTNLGMMLPFVLLSTAEANRMENYLQLGQFSPASAKLPWNLPGYCAQGGYNSCTHWFGEMPIGDTLKAEYTFPGKVDQHATNPAVTTPGPQTAPLGRYWENPAYSNGLKPLSGQIVFDPNLGSGFSPERGHQLVDRLTRMVWQAPGHQHFADMLGVEDAKLRGEFANPGYVAFALLGGVAAQRVPVTFIVQADETQLAADFTLGIHAY